MRAAKRREKVIERHLVRDVNGRKPQGQFLVFCAEQVIRTDAKVKEIARSNTRRIGIVVLSAVSRNAYAQSTAVRRQAAE